MCNIHFTYFGPGLKSVAVKQIFLGGKPMKTLLLTLVMMMGASAFADGFLCQNLNQNLIIHVYDQTTPSTGTRDAAVMIVSDPTMSPGDRTTATFTAQNDLVSNVDATYIADVDLQSPGSDKGGRNIGGTKLADVQYIILAVDFSYSSPVPNGTVVDGDVTLNKRNGDENHIAVSCTRYLKGN
jgi:hypothetical protein